jgi:hypothetical protein
VSESLLLSAIMSIFSYILPKTKHFHEMLAMFA